MANVPSSTFDPKIYFETDVDLESIKKSGNSYIADYDSFKGSIYNSIIKLYNKSTSVKGMIDKYIEALPNKNDIKKIKILVGTTKASELLSDSIIYINTDDINNVKYLSKMGIYPKYLLILSYLMSLVIFSQDQKT